MARSFIAAQFASVRKRFIDTFTRSNQSGLGTADDGSSWTVTRGSWSISSNTAVGNDANYPMAVQNMGVKDVTVSVKGALQGTAAALWVTDSGNWWAVGIDQTTTSCNCQTCYNYFPYYPATYTPGNYVSGNYVAGNYVAGNTVCTYWQNSNAACAIA